MGLMYVILPATLLLAAVFVLLFVRSTRRGQFDDMRTPPLRAVFDDDPPSALPRRAAAAKPLEPSSADDTRKS